MIFLKASGERQAKEGKEGKEREKAPTPAGQGKDGEEEFHYLPGQSPYGDTDEVARHPFHFNETSD